MDEASTNAGTARTKTVADIWEEVQIEQRRFNQIVKVLVGLLIVAAVIAGVLAAVSYLRFNEVTTRYDALIHDAEVAATLSAGDGVRQRQTMVNELLTIREETDAQRQESQLTRQVDQALSAARAGVALQSVAELTTQAVDAAEDHLIGHRLNPATSYLVNSILESRGTQLSDDQRRIMATALLDWRTPDASHDSIRELISQSADDRVKGYGHAALAQYFYKQASAANDLGASEACTDVVQEVNLAKSAGVEGMVPHLWKGECLRDQGRQKEAFLAYTDALRAGNVDEETLTNRRLAAHGAGTTLVARAARAPNATLSPDEVSSAFEALGPIIGEVEGLQGAADEEDPLAAAYALLNYAADMRSKRGEGEVGKSYTAENIGFIFVMREKWADGLKHAQAIDKLIPLGWNLTVLHICASQMAEDPDISSDERKLYLAEADRARRTLAKMDHRRIGESELKKLLPVEYDNLVDELVKPSREAMEKASANPVNFVPGQ